MAHGVGELDLNAPAVPPRNDFVNDECPYLLLDVRARDEFDQCHIISGCEISFNTRVPTRPTKPGKMEF